PARAETGFGRFRRRFLAAFGSWSIDLAHEHRRKKTYEARFNLTLSTSVKDHDRFRETAMVFFARDRPPPLWAPPWTERRFPGILAHDQCPDGNSPSGAPPRETYPWILFWRSPPIPRPGSPFLHLSRWRSCLASTISSSSPFSLRNCRRRKQRSRGASGSAYRLFSGCCSWLARPMPSTSPGPCSRFSARIFPGAILSPTSAIGKTATRKC